MKLELSDQQQSNNQNVVQKQVKQKILQASQEEALFVQTSQALQSKMEKVEQQLSTSMNGYHIGHHLKANQMNQLPPKCPTIEDSTVKSQESSKKQDDNNLASAYFQEKYGATQESNGQNTHTVNNNNNGHSYRYVGYFVCHFGGGI